MIELTFQEFHNQQYQEDRFCLYVIKNRREDILYIGISTSNIWERWFAWGGHMVWDGKVIYGESPIGVKIEDHLPDSLRRRIQLWTLDDCIQFCTTELPEDTSALTIGDVEPIMIRKLSPALNVIYNLHPGKDGTPKSKKKKSNTRNILIRCTGRSSTKRRKAYLPYPAMPILTMMSWTKATTKSLRRNEISNCL